MRCLNTFTNSPQTSRAKCPNKDVSLEIESISVRVLWRPHALVQNATLPDFCLCVCSSSALYSYSSHSSWSSNRRAHTLRPSETQKQSQIGFGSDFLNTLGHADQEEKWSATFLSRKEAIRPKFFGCWMNLERWRIKSSWRVNMAKRSKSTTHEGQHLINGK